MSVGKKILMRAFGLPQGLLGRLGGIIMARTNRKVAAWAIDLLDVRPNDSVLEVGFGPGVGIELLAKLVTSGRVVGVDYSEEMVAQARARNANAIEGGRVDLRRGSVERLPFEDGTFDKALPRAFSKARRNPYASRLKRQVTIRRDEQTIKYFKSISDECGIPYQTLINLYLRDCAATGCSVRFHGSAPPPATFPSPLTLPVPPRILRPRVRRFREREGSSLPLTIVRDGYSSRPFSSTIDGGRTMRTPSGRRTKSRRRLRHRRRQPCPRFAAS